MKHYTPIIFMLLLVGQAYAQTYTYTLDPLTFSIVDESAADTILSTTNSNSLRTQTSFVLKKKGGLGSIRLRALDNPQISLRDDDGAQNVQILTNVNGSGGAIWLSDLVNGDTNSLVLTTNYAGTNDARVITDELQINGGSDLAEMFDVSDLDTEVLPGMLVSIDPKHPGQLRLTTDPFDQKIAGIVSGANGVKPGILMGQKNTEAYGDDLITLSGRTYVKANTSNGKIKVGDLLTSSATKGEAMRTKRGRKAQGAIIGKAMTALNEGSDFVLVLVNLQ